MGLDTSHDAWHGDGLVEDRGHIGNYRAKTETFIRGLRAAAEAGEDLEFF